MLFIAISIALVSLALATPMRAVAAEPIRVGYLGPLTGIFAQAGKDMLEGLKMGFEQAGHQAAGRKIELLEEDTEGNPATAQAKYRKLAQQDRINVLAGVLLSNIGYALVPPIERDQIPTLFLTTPDDLTKRRRTKWIMRSNFSASQPMHALGDYAAKTLRYKRVAAIAMDNAFGHEGIGGFQRVFEDHGGLVVQKTWVPLNALDFAPYLAQIRRDVDAVVQVFVAAQAVRWITEAARALDGQVEDREKFLGALRAAIEKTEDPRGPIKLDEYNNPTENVYILKVEKVGGRLQNTVIHTYPLVSQFWTYKAEEF